MKAFVGHSFAPKDVELVHDIIEFLRDAGIECETAEKAENRSIADKVKEKISHNDMFVGIFTCDEQIKGEAGSFNLFKKKAAYTTSNWVVQESGFAIGCEKELIFLVEKGIYKFPELQGDLEVIPFERKSLDQIYFKLNQMMKSIKSKKIVAPSVETERSVEAVGKQKIETEEEKVKDEVEEKKREAYKKVFAAIKDRDYTRLNQVYEKELEPQLGEQQKPVWRASVLRRSHEFGDSHAFDGLIKHVEQNKDNPDVIRHLVLRYKDMREFDKARGEFLKMSKLYDINVKEDKEKTVDCYEQASLCLAYESKYDEAMTSLAQLLYKEELLECKSKILSTLAKIAKMRKDPEKLFIYAEGALNIDPSNTDLRFDLAYRYSDEGHSRLSLLNYKKLTDSVKSPSGLNNLGVEYGTLELPAKSIQSYFKAAGYNNTLAMANIANRYLKEGFAEDAERIIKKANDLSKVSIEVHGDVGVAKNRLDKILTEEDGKEKEILAKAEREREFRVKYSEAFCWPKKVIKQNIEGIWETPWGKLKLNYEDTTNGLKLTGKQKEKLPPLAPLLGLKPETEKEHFEEKLITIEGHVVKFSARCKMEIEDVTQPKYTQLGLRKEYEASLYVVIAEDHRSIEVMEKTTEDKIKFYTWKKQVP